MTFKIDTGATVVLERVYQISRDGQLDQPSRELRGPDKHPLTVIGQFTAQLRRTGENVKETMETVYVAKSLLTPLVGRPAVESLQLVSTQLSEEVHVISYFLQTPCHVPISFFQKSRLS